MRDHTPVHPTGLFHEDPTDVLGREAEATEAGLAEALAAEERRRELSLWVKQPLGRRVLRRELWEAGFRVGDAYVETWFSKNYGEMCRDSEKRLRGARLAWHLLQAVARDEIPREELQLLMNEQDHD